MARSITMAVAAASLLLVVLSGASALGQCPLPDMLDGGACCTAAQPMLPPFPSFQQDSIEICWEHCQPSQVINWVASWTAPQPAQTSSIPVICTVFTSKVKLFDSSGNLAWSGRMRMWYSRTWVEPDPAGAVTQVWRFLLNGDLKPQTAAGTPPCPVPPCASAFGNRVRFTGYLDFALDCNTGVFSECWMLDHESDKLDHRPPFPRSGAFHNTRSYTFVGPSAGFVIDPNLPVETGAIPLEAVRRMDLPLPGTTAVCYYEEPPVAGQGLMTPLLNLCIGGGGSAPPQYQYSNLRYVGVCGTNIISAMQWPKGFLSKSIGSWTDPAVYPGPESVRWNLGGYEYDDCTGVTRGEVFYGVTTMGGFPAAQLLSSGMGQPLPLTFVDAGNSLKFGPNTTIMNVQYVSDHILNLNM